MMKRAQSAERRAQSVLLGALLLAGAPLAAQPKASCTLVAARPIARGTLLTEDDIAVSGEQSGSAPRESGGCALRSALVGSASRRVIAAGEALREPAIAAPNAVQSGQKVAVVYRESGIEVRLAGTAANAAPIGGRVTIRIDPSLRSGQASRRLEGVAVAPGLVQIR